ncbi:hypothetical protein [Sphaerisporangium rufum]|uniref:hypothetical protein n=1 Tax=Sphaerisporangium rufum TaxID=1381558 RepID=UPI00194FFB34|nr:hypothetical protein [Sphaerisporangium rufum]
MVVLLALSFAALAVLYCVVKVAQGHGGELVEFAPDVPELHLPDPSRLTAVDFMALRLPMSVVGYHTQSVDEALQRAATAIGERDTHIAVLEQRVAELLSGRMQARQGNYMRPSYAPESPGAEPEPGPAPWFAEAAGMTGRPAEILGHPGEDTDPTGAPGARFDAFSPIVESPRENGTAEGTPATGTGAGSAERGPAEDPKPGRAAAEPSGRTAEEADTPADGVPALPKRPKAGGDRAGDPPPAGVRDRR